MQHRLKAVRRTGMCASGVRETTQEESGLGRRTGRTGEQAPAHPFSSRGTGRRFLV